MVNQQQIREAQRLASFAVLHRNAPAWEEAKRLYAVAIGGLFTDGNFIRARPDRGNDQR